MNKTQLGELTDGHIKDAVYVAVFSAKSDQVVHPSQRVKLYYGRVDKVVPSLPNEPSIGIVDPFLMESPRIGAFFLVVVYPNTVTDLRHEWTHPDYDEGPTPFTDSLSAEDEEDECAGC